MRDPKRIDRVLALIADYWRSHPDLRLGQIIGNIVGACDPYHFEDDVIETSLSSYVADSQLMTLARVTANLPDVDSVDHLLDADPPTPVITADAPGARICAAMPGAQNPRNRIPDLWPEDICEPMPEAKPEPERYWRVRPVRGEGLWEVVSCLEDGTVLPRPMVRRTFVTRAEAESDGRASGLPMWRGGKP